MIALKFKGTTLKISNSHRDTNFPRLSIFHEKTETPSDDSRYSKIIFTWIYIADISTSNRNKNMLSKEETHECFGINLHRMRLNFYNPFSSFSHPSSPRTEWMLKKCTKCSCYDCVRRLMAHRYKIITHLLASHMFRVNINLEWEVKLTTQTLESEGQSHPDCLSHSATFAQRVAKERSAVRTHCLDWTSWRLSRRDVVEKSDKFVQSFAFLSFCSPHRVSDYEVERKTSTLFEMSFDELFER